ncbi:hypothetical protein EVAR_42041_1 [Eumeta japonica]|uniref:Uncharacterized protein n=1 Tax=Eumeta variegata TaxID=151549 RepID=A0A4C1Y6Q4_EUMVA|nr:hypothetical protein EVAR_42041_1 [Eumeta japonica]
MAAFRTLKPPSEGVRRLQLCFNRDVKLQTINLPEDARKVLSERFSATYHYFVHANEISQKLKLAHSREPGRASTGASTGASAADPITAN